MADFDSRIDALKAFAEGQDCHRRHDHQRQLQCSGNDGRCSIIGKEIGFENIGVDANIDTSTHGNEASFEFIVDKNPDYIFAMDRDAAIGTDGAQMAQEIRKTSWSRARMLTRTATSFIWHTRMSGTPQRAAFRH